MVKIYLLPYTDQRNSVEMIQRLRRAEESLGGDLHLDTLLKIEARTPEVMLKVDKFLKEFGWWENAVSQPEDPDSLMAATPQP